MTKQVPADMFEGNIFSTNGCGDVKIINYSSAKKVLIEFIDTGYRRIASTGHIRGGRVKDRTKPSIYGVGFLGVGEHGSKSSPCAYIKWMGMLKRCYSERNLEKYPTYRDVSVCEEWHNFQNFAEWFYKNNKVGYDLDKDILVDGNKIYSPNTCKFVKHSDNMIKAHAKSYVVVSPSGDVIEFYNLRDFCRKNNLDSGTMCNMINGKFSQYKGWTIPLDSKSK